MNKTVFMICITRFGSKATTRKDAREKDTSITEEDVEEFFTKKKVEEKCKTRGGNGFAAPHALLELQLDLFVTYARFRKPEA